MLSKTDKHIEVYSLTSTGLEAKGFEDGSTFWDALQKKQLWWYFNDTAKRLQPQLAAAVPYTFFVASAFRHWLPC